MIATAAERHTYEGWKRLGRQVKSGQRRGADGKFGYEQTKAIGNAGSGPQTLHVRGCRINYGLYCGKCEYR